ncbi:MAG: glycine cleavage system aminomethyltransferase GcvT [Candidatus Bathyarchaeota archaeon]|nr:MAG: glycine cleavage system aminomethyltransferase GcvT [Candidatus Bathyarchaeota archaeon]
MHGKTHLYSFHAQNGKVVPFAGFEMPIWYKGIIPEHLAVRNNVGIFDVTHMGRVTITGKSAEAFLNYVTTNDVSTLARLDAQYSTMCNDEGGIIDDFVISRQEENQYFMVYNAANREKNYKWLTRHATDYNVRIDDLSNNVAMFAVQGPRSQQTLQKISTEDLDQIKRFKCGWTTIAGSKTFISRTGYTGEDGFELFVWNTHTSKPKKAVDAWKAILEAGKEFNIEPCGLGARDTLRLEAGMCLYGNDIDESITPLEARISFVVQLQKAKFKGKQKLLRQKEEGIKKRRVGLKMIEEGVPRPKHDVLTDEKKIGWVTSGTFSPLLKKGIAMAYVQREYGKMSQTVDVRIRKRQVKAEIVKFPFYDPTKFGYTRKQ